MKNPFKIFSAILILLFLFTQIESKGQDVSPILQHQFVTAETNPLDYQLEYCKIWGLVKYYHPDASKNRKDIDQIFLDLYPEMTSLQDDVSFNRFIAKFMGHFKDMNADKLGDDEYKAVLENQLEKTKKFNFLKDSVSYYSNLDFSWLKESSLSPELKKKVVAILLCSNSKKTPNLTGRYFNEDKLEDFKGIDSVSATLSLFKYWNIVAYKYPYVYLLDEDWSQAFLKNYIHFTQIKNRQEYLQAIQRVVAATQDNHSSVSDMGKTRGDIMIYPFEMSFAEGNIVVKRVVNKGFCERNDIHVGDIVSSIDGKTVSELYDSLKNFIPCSIAENFPEQFINHLNYYELFPDTIQVKFNGLESTTKTVCLLPISIQSYKDIYHPSQKYKILHDSIAYINNPVMPSKKEEKEVFEKIKDCRTVILDFRRYPIVDGMNYLIPRLADEPKKVGSSFLSVGNLAGIFKKGFTISYAGIMSGGIPIKSPNYPKQIIILIGNGAQSAMETHCMMAKVYAPQAVFIGGKTAGADGFVKFIDLPDNIRVFLAITDFRFADGTLIQRKGIQPDIEVRPTVQGIKEGRDEVLERAIEYIRNGK